MYLRLLGKSLANRKSRVAVAVLAVVMGAAIASALLTTSMAVKNKIGAEFRKLGANIMVIPKSDTVEVGLPGMPFGSVTEQRYINESDLWNIKKIDNWSANVLGYAPFLYQVVNVTAGDSAQNIVLAGTYFEHEEQKVLDGAGNPWKTGLREIAPYWDVSGEWVGESDLNGSVVGSLVALRFGLSEGSSFSVKYLNPETQVSASRTFAVKGIVTTGGSEDSQIFVNLKAAQELSSRPDKVHSVQVSALCTACPAELIGAEIQHKLPNVQAKSVKQLVLAEEDIMMRLERMMAFITFVALGASALGVMTTMTTTVLERKKEIGIMKAIGADSRRVASQFLAEAALVGVLGGAIGYAVGFGLAQFIGRSVFDSSVSFVPIVVPITIGLSLGIALLASALPVRRAVRIEPAVVLRGD